MQQPQRFSVTRRAVYVQFAVSRLLFEYFVMVHNAMYAQFCEAVREKREARGSTYLSAKDLDGLFCGWRRTHIGRRAGVQGEYKLAFDETTVVEWRQGK